MLQKENTDAVTLRNGSSKPRRTVLESPPVFGSIAKLQFVSENWPNENQIHRLSSSGVDSFRKETPGFRFFVRVYTKGIKYEKDLISKLKFGEDASAEIDD